MAINFLETSRGVVNLNHVFYLKEKGLSGSWELILGGSKPGSRTNEIMSGEAFEKWLSQLPSGWVEVFDLDLGHYLVNLGATSAAYSNGPDPVRGERYTFVPASSTVGVIQYEHELTVRVKEDSLPALIASADQPVAKRVRWGMKELERERS